MATVNSSSFLDAALAPHLRLELHPDEMPKYVRIKEKKGGAEANHLQGTVEADNKRRQSVQKQNSQRFLKIPPETPDPNSEPKSMVIDKMQLRLESWNQDMAKIQEKKLKNDNILKQELTQRDEKISDLSEKYAKECEIRSKTETERNNLNAKLRVTEQTLNECRMQNSQLQSELSQSQIAYAQTEERRSELEETALELQDKVVQIEEMKRRLNDQVTELQGQVSMLQRSSACNIL